MIPTMDPAGISRLTFRTAFTPAKALETPSRASRGAVDVTGRAETRLGPLGDASPFAERRRGVREWLGGELLRPDQLLLAVDPLEERAQHDSGAVRTELHRPDDGGHVRRGDRVADLVAIRRAGLVEGRREDLNARVRRAGHRIRGPADPL